MYIQANTMSHTNYSTPALANSKYGINKKMQEENQKTNSNTQDKKILSGIALQANQASLSPTGDSQTKALYKQLDTLQKEMTKVKESDLDSKSKNDAIKDLQTQMADLQKQLAELQQKEVTEKKEKEDTSNIYLTDEEKKQAAQKAESEMMSNLASATSQIKIAEAPLAQARKHITEAKLGMGAKYGGNLSAGEVSSLFNKATHSLSYATNNLRDANGLSKETVNAIKEYQKHTREKSEAETKTETES